MRTKKILVLVAVAVVLVLSSILGTYAVMHHKYHGGLKDTAVSKYGNILVLYNDGTVVETGAITGEIDGYEK